MANAIVKVPVAAGRKELGWQVASLGLKGTQGQDQIAAIILDKDADFVVMRAWICQFRNQTAVSLPSGTTLNFRDGTSTKRLFLQSEPAENLAGFLSIPPTLVRSVGGGLGTNIINGQQQGGGLYRVLAAVKGLPAPYLMRAGTSCYVEITNPNYAAANWPGDLLIVFEGFRVYPGQADPIPREITGAAFPFVWNGSLTIAALPAAGLASVGNIVMTGPGQGKFYLKGCMAEIIAANNEGFGNTDFEDQIAVQIVDSQSSQKAWIRTNQQSALLSYMPLSILTVGKTGEPWKYPRYLEGNSQLTATLFMDAASGFQAAMFPMTIKLDFMAVMVP